MLYSNRKARFLASSRKKRLFFMIIGNPVMRISDAQQIWKLKTKKDSKWFNLSLFISTQTAQYQCFYPKQLQYQICKIKNTTNSHTVLAEDVSINLVHRLYRLHHYPFVQANMAGNYYGFNSNQCYRITNLPWTAHYTASPPHLDMHCFNLDKSVMTNATAVNAKLIIQVNNDILPQISEK